MSGYDAAWLATVTGGRWTRMPERPLTAVVNDSRRRVQDALYVALRGERFDGHAFVANAFLSGAAAAMVEAAGEIPADAKGFPLLVVESTQAALSALGAAHRRQVAPLVVGVTGSVGKSTVKEMTASVLSAAGVTARTCGNWNNEIGLPLSLLAMAPQARYGVFEAGMNHPGEIRRLCEVLQPDWGVVTMIGPVHLEHFESEEGIAREKGELLRALPSDGRAFLCRDDKWFPLLQTMARCVVRSVSLEGDADLVLQHDEAGCQLQATERASGGTQRFAWPWAGRHNALNGGFAILVGREAGLSWEQIGQGLAGYQPLPMRWQEVSVGGCLLINDAYNANPASMRAALKTFAGLAGSARRWLVLGDMLEIGETEQAVHETLGSEVPAAADWAGLLTVGPLAVWIADGARRQGMDPERIWRCSDTHTAATVLREQLLPGDAVLFKASRGVALEKVIDELGR